MWLYGRNVIREILSSGKAIHEVLVLKGMKDIEDVIKEAEKRGVVVTYTDRQTLDKKTGTEKHQGIVADVEDIRFLTVDEFIKKANGREECTVAVLDEIEDPHNFGAIIRSAEVFGIDAIVIQNKRNSPVTPTVYKSSSGAIEYIDMIEVVNISNAIEALKKAGFWIYGFDLTAEKYLDETEFDKKTAFVFGNEGRGIRQLVKKNCDFMVKIRQKGRLDSLNVSNAAAVTFYSRMFVKPAKNK
ncbi:MAG: 23S rRNA (guanosine(2251)-2'-O)-methyltransferase RlmB [bacterium]